MCICIVGMCNCVCVRIKLYVIFSTIFFRPEYFV